MTPSRPSPVIVRPQEKSGFPGAFAAGIILPGNYKALGNVAERAFKIRLMIL